MRVIVAIINYSKSSKSNKTIRVVELFQKENPISENDKNVNFASVSVLDGNLCKYTNFDTSKKLCAGDTKVCRSTDFFTF